jgi:hypothetical protein
VCVRETGLSDVDAFRCTVPPRNLCKRGARHRPSAMGSAVFARLRLQPADRRYVLAREFVVLMTAGQMGDRSRWFRSTVSKDDSAGAWRWRNRDTRGMCAIHGNQRSQWNRNCLQRYWLERHRAARDRRLSYRLVIEISLTKKRVSMRDPGIMAHGRNH